MTRILIALVLASMTVAARAGDDWPQFRGPDGQGHSAARGLPVAWSETENITWKSEIPGRGWSSPVVGDGRIWMTTAVDEGHSLRAVCVDLASGRLLHDVELFQVEQPERINAKNSYASPTPVLEGNRLWVHFGTYGTACLDSATGAVQWTNREHRLDHKEGPGSSPILWGDLLIFHCDGQDVQYVAALDKHSGRLVWRTDRTGALAPNPDQRKAYATPLVVVAGGRPQLVSTGADRGYAYDLVTGEELWHVDYKGYSNVARPVVGGDLVILNTGYNKPELWAVRPEGRGDVTDTHVAWRATAQVPANPSPIVVGHELFMASDQGVLTCIDARTGREHFKTRLGGNFSASPIAAAGRIYFPGESGETTVIEAATEYRELARNMLDGRLMASFAVVADALLVRSDTHLYRIETADR